MFESLDCLAAGFCMSGAPSENVPLGDCFSAIETACTRRQAYRRAQTVDDRPDGLTTNTRSFGRYVVEIQHGMPQDVAKEQSGL